MTILSRRRGRRSRWASLLAACLIIAACAGPSPAAAPDHAQIGLTVSPDGRRLLRSDGGVFFWLADTAWELFHRLDREEADLYLRDRAGKGFTVIQAVVLAELDGLRVPNPYDAVPLLDEDPSRPNEAYFEHVDFIVERAAELGMYIGMLPTWGDKFNLRWGAGPEVFTPENARAFGEFLGERYRDKPVVWILGGDRNPESETHLAIIRAMAAGIRDATRGTQLMTYHPMGGSSSVRWFHDDDWLDLHMFQSGHARRDIANYEMATSAYDLEPPKPLVDGEPRYEDHPVDWKPEEGWFDAFDVRQAAYWSVLAGAAGHTYGDHNLWQMWEPGREAISSARTPWRRALAHPGAAQAGFMRRLFESRPFAELVPDQGLLHETPVEPGARQRAARDSSGRFLIAYSPYGYPLEVITESLRAGRFRAYWFDPRTGVSTEIGILSRQPRLRFEPPGVPARGNDWVLVLDDAREGFPPPG